MLSWVFVFSVPCNVDSLPRLKTRSWAISDVMECVGCHASSTVKRREFIHARANITWHTSTFEGTEIKGEDNWAYSTNISIMARIDWQFLMHCPSCVLIWRQRLQLHLSHTHTDTYTHTHSLKSTENNVPDKQTKRAVHCVRRCQIWLLYIELWQVCPDLRFPLHDSRPITPALLAVLVFFSCHRPEAGSTKMSDV